MGTEVRQIDLSDPSTYSKGEVILVTDKYGWPFEFLLNGCKEHLMGKFILIAQIQALLLM